MSGLEGDHRSAGQVGICMKKHYTFIPNILHLSPCTLVVKFGIGKKNNEVQRNYWKVGQNQRPLVGAKCFTFITMPCTI
jgi:hypothetical protein